MHTDSFLSGSSSRKVTSYAYQKVRVKDKEQIQTIYPAHTHFLYTWYVLTTNPKVHIIQKQRQGLEVWLKQYNINFCKCEALNSNPSTIKNLKKYIYVYVYVYIYIYIYIYIFPLALSNIGDKFYVLTFPLYFSFIY
jgi:hypothetical protein